MTKSTQAPAPSTSAPMLVLGLDLGVSSVGWALLELNPSTQEPIGVRALGVRIFPAGVEGDVSSGRDESRGVKRRERRLQRRQLWRRARRDASVFFALQSAGLLPAGRGRDPVVRHEMLLALDSEIAKSLLASGIAKDRVGERMPYLLRESALTDSLPAHHVGRAFYHLAQRRGFLSNRITDASEPDAKPDDELGVVKGGIQSLADEIAAAKAPTLGAFLASRSSDEGVRRRYTARQMFKDEFDEIWAAQQPHHTTEMTDDAKALIHRAIFRQRPLKSQRHLVARCELEPRSKRSMIADPLFQEFRILQAVNHIKVELSESDAGTVLSGEQRQTLVDALMQVTEMSFSKIRTLLKLPRTSKFNLERGGEKRLIGNRTYVRLHTALGESLAALSESDHLRLVHLLLFCDNEATIQRVGSQYLGLDAERAGYLALTTMEPGTAALSRRALRKMLELMRAGTAYSTARAALYPRPAVAPRDELPPVQRHIRSLKNPAVLRTLTELRHVVNAIVKKYGVPDRVRIELARDMKRPRKVRIEMSKTMRGRADERTEAISAIEKELGITNASRNDVEKYLLWKECNAECPYTGQRIGLRDLISKHPTVDVEHIIPYAISLDDSFANKTLCISAENRNVKKRQSPWTAYSGHEEKWSEILARVDRFRGTAARRKRQQFRMETVPSDFSDRQLNDTRHASVLAQDYVGMLFGGAVDASGERRVEASSGGITAHVRRALDLSQLLGGDGEKTRSDHRHHAVDAVAIASTNRWIVEQLQRAASAPDARAGRTPALEITDVMRSAVAEHLESVLVSHRRPKSGGPLHDETLYGKHHDGTTVIRKPVTALKLAALDEIIDPVIRDCVKRACGDREPEKEFANGAWPRMASGTPIKRVRISSSVKLVAVATGPRQRLVKPNGNSHLELFVNDNGTKLQWRIVTRLAAYRKRVADGSVVDESPPAAGWRYLTTLRVGDMLTRMKSAGRDGETIETLVLENISDAQLELKRHDDARPAASRRKIKGSRIIVSQSSFLTDRYRRVSIDSLGSARPSDA